MVKYLRLWLLFLLSIAIWMQISLRPSKAFSEQEVNFQQAQYYYQKGQYKEAITLWVDLLNSNSAIDQGVLNSYLGAAYNQIGNFRVAITHWQAAEKIYRDSKSTKQLAAVLVDQADAYNSLGQFSKAIPLSLEAITLSPSDEINAAATSVLGTSYLISGNYDQAIENYQKSLDLTSMNVRKTAILNNQSKAFSLRSQRYLKLANYAASEGDTNTERKNNSNSILDQKAAIEKAQRAVEISLATPTLETVTAMLNLMKLSSFDYRKQIREILATAPPSRKKAYALINLAKLESTDKAIKDLEEAISMCREIASERTLSEALGNLGSIYEKALNYDLALKYSQDAQNVAQLNSAFDLLYRWLWQAGRIYRSRGQSEEATIAYKQAIATLQSIRQDIATANPELQLDFREQIQPVYRELLKLLLAGETTENIKEALSILELFQLSELQNFFGDDCVQVINAAKSPQEMLAFTNTAVIYSIILDNKTYIILQLPSGKTTKYAINISQTNLEQQVKQWRRKLEKISSNSYKELSISLYDLLFRPLETDLKASAPQNLLFINDGILRNVPMAALHDGSEFLIQKYAIINSLGLNFSLKATNSSTQLHPLIFGLSDPMPPFDPLPFVEL